MTQPPPERPDGPAVGPLAMEAALLLDVVAERLVSLKRSTGSSTAAADGAGDGPDGDDPAAEPGQPHAGASGDATDSGPPRALGASGVGHRAGAGGAGPGAGGTGAGGTGAICPECGSVPGASCTACPLCRFMALLRGERPEATAKLVDGALMIIRTLRSLVPDPSESTGTTTTGPGHGEPSPGHQPPTRRGGLEHIDIS